MNHTHRTENLPLRDEMMMILRHARMRLSVAVSFFNFISHEPNKPVDREAKTFIVSHLIFFLFPLILWTPLCIYTTLAHLNVFRDIQNGHARLWR